MPFTLIIIEFSITILEDYCEIEMCVTSKIDFFPVYFRFSTMTEIFRISNRKNILSLMPNFLPGIKKQNSLWRSSCTHPHGIISCSRLLPLLSFLSRQSR